MGYRPKYLRLYELFPRELYERFKHDPLRLWSLMDDRVLWTADQLRERFGAIRVNDWRSRDGGFQLRGFRPWDTDIGAALSQHKFGRALDCNFKNATAQEVQVDIRENQNRPQYLHITCIEDGVSWLHFDVRNHERQKYGLLIIKPRA